MQIAALQQGPFLPLNWVKTKVSDYTYKAPALFDKFRWFALPGTKAYVKTAVLFFQITI